MTNGTTRLTIFQKMLVAPFIGLALYSVFLFYLHGEHEHSSKMVAEIRDAYLPALELASENVILFDSIPAHLKDAVLAGEEEWAQNTRKEKEQIEANLKQLASYDSLVHKENIERLSKSFGNYYKNAVALSMAMLKKHLGAEKQNELIESVERLHGQADKVLNDIKVNLRNDLSRKISQTNHRLDRLVFVGVGMGVILIVVIIGVTFAMSISTRRSLGEVNIALKNIANEKPDFSARLSRHSDDELGEMVSWFNLLSEKLEKDYKKIELLSITDKLTQLYNRTKIDEVFQNEINKANRYHEQFSMIIMDIDHFKSVNDTFGHQVGDTILQEIAKILRENVRNTDYLGRWGGEEFVILSPNTPLEQGRQLAEKLRTAIKSFSFAQVGEKTGSFGVSSFREGDNEDTMTKRADDCLYIAKNRGRNVVVIESGL